MSVNYSFSPRGSRGKSILRAVCLLLASAGWAWGQLLLPVQDSKGRGFYKAGELLVKFKTTAGDAQLADAVRQGALRIKEYLDSHPLRAAGREGLTVAFSDLPVEVAAQILSRHPGIDYAEPNWVYTHTATADDSYYTGGSLWGMYGDATTPANQYGSQAGEAWAAGPGYTGSRDVYVGVIDEGIQFTHPDLAGNGWINPFDPVDGVDNDGNNYVDDVNGWDFFGRNNSIYDGTGDDHGTHVTGTIAAKGGNGAGVAGVNWNVTYISGKFLGPQGGSTADAVKAIDYFTDLKTRHGLNIVALNNSWGGGGYSQALHDAIIRAAKAGILFIAAAGNSGSNNDAVASYPSNYDTSQGTATEAAASYDAVIAVAAIDSNGNKASFSSYGATKVDLGAPGVGVWSTLPGPVTSPGNYGSYSGTSMATPHVTGAAALYASIYPGKAASDIKTAILASASATPTSSMAGRTVTGGRLNISHFIPAGPQPPVAQAGPDQTTSDGDANDSQSVTLNGSTSVDPDGGAISYEWKEGDTVLGTAAILPVNLSVGIHILTLTVTDDENATATDSVVVTVNPNQAPTANAGPDKTVNDSDGNDTQTVTLVGLGSDPDGTIYYEWKEANTVIGTTATLTRSFPVGTHNLTLTVTDNGGATAYDSVTVTVTAFVPQIEVFADSFEVSEWNGLWSEDSQNDWFRSAQRSAYGGYSAEVDGKANGAQLISIPINLQGRTQATITFSWFIESSLDSGEYIAFDVSVNGGAWSERARLRGNVDPENTWLNRQIDLTGLTSLRIRFRGNMSASDEDANVDFVKVLAK